MRFRRPRSLNGLILVGFALVAVPLLLSVIWALFSLDRLAEQSERLVVTGVQAAENNRLLSETVNSLERVTHTTGREWFGVAERMQDRNRAVTHHDRCEVLRTLETAWYRLGCRSRPTRLTDRRAAGDIRTRTPYRGTPTPPRSGRLRSGT